MPKLEEPILLEDGLAIGYRKTQKGAYWYSRHFYKGESGSKYIALKIPYEKGRASQRAAAKAARINHHEDYLPKAEAGLPTTASLDIAQIAKRYIAWIQSSMKENAERIEAGKKPINKNLTDNYFWDKVNGDAEINNLNQLEPFWPTLPTTKLRQLKIRDLDSFSVWAQRNTEWSPSTIGYRVTAIRNIYRFIQNEYRIDVAIPPLKVPPMDLKNRKRKPFTAKIYYKMLDYARKNYERFDLEENPNQWGNKDLAFQFLCFFELLSWSGFRPQYKVEKNFPKWADIKKIKVGTPDETWVIRRHSEKNASRL